MNKPLSLLTAALLLTGASSAFAASSTDLTVTGTITPAACTPSLANGGVVDYGKIAAKDLNQATPTFLEEKIVQLSVSCDASALFAINTVDNRPNTASASGGANFGLGLINVSEKLGGYYMDFINPVADVPVTTIMSSDDGNTWTEYTEDHLKPRDNWLAFGAQTSGAWAPVPVLNVSVDLEVGAFISPANTLTLTNEVSMDGNATLEVKYL